MQCEDLSGALAATADGDGGLSRAERRHVERCLRCQAEVVQYRKLLRAMRTLRTDVWSRPPGCWPTSSPPSRRRASARPCGPCSTVAASPTSAGSPPRRRPVPRAPSCSPPAPAAPASPAERRRLTRRSTNDRPPAHLSDGPGSTIRHGVFRPRGARMGLHVRHRRLHRRVSGGGGRGRAATGRCARCWSGRCPNRPRWATRSPRPRAASRSSTTRPA